MSFIYKFCVCVLLAVSSMALPTQVEEGTANAIGVSSNIITASILKSNVDSDSNFVFAPIGFSTILAILNEGAREHTRAEITETMRFPPSVERIRTTYRDGLQRLQGDDPLTAPQFRTWLYIYRNNSIEDDFRQSLTNNFFVDVRDINRDYYNWTTTTAAPVTAEEIHVTAASTQLPSVTAAASDAGNSKDITEFEELKKSEPVPLDEGRIDNQKDSSKFDEVVEDKQYVEAPVIREQLTKEKEDNKNEATPASLMDKKEDSKPVETPVAVIEKVDEKMSTTEKANIQLNGGQIEVKIVFDELEKAMKQVDEKVKVEAAKELVKNEIVGETARVARASDDDFIVKWEKLAREQKFDGDATSGLSGNSLVGSKSDANEKDVESKMLLFNGLFFRGSWAIPFQQLRSGPDDFFYISETEKVRATLMRGRGAYRYAEIPSLDAQAVEIPYENERYALMFLAPLSKTGLKDLINKMEFNTLAQIESQLHEESLNVIVPKIKLETTSRAEKPLAKLGLASLFTSKSDLSGISKDVHLQVDELVQHVALRVDEGSSSENALSAANELRSNLVPEKTVTVDRPCLFFVRDILDDVVIVAGKIVTPPSVDEPAFQSHHSS